MSTDDPTTIAEDAPADVAEAVEAATDGASASREPARLKAFYEQEVRGRLQEEFGYASPMQHPKLVKITLNMGVG